MSRNLIDYLAASAAAYPQRTAVVDSAGRRVSYAELLLLARRVAAFLAARGVTTGDRVGVVAPKSIEGVGVILGAMAAGAAYVPADFAAPAARNRRILDDCSVRVLFLDPQHASILDGWRSDERPVVTFLPGDPAGSAIPGSESWEAVLECAPLQPDRLAPPDGLAYILYTSGSTGIPKGVAISHLNATSFVEWCSREFAPGPDDRFSSHAPFHFDLSILDLYLALKHGATINLVSEVAAKNPQELAAFIESRRLTVWYSTPSILALLAQFGRLEGRDCSSLRLVLFAGEVFPVKHLRAIAAAWPQAAFYNLYGPTETNVCTFARIPAEVPVARTEPYPIGHLCSHCSGLVLDGPGGSAVSAGDEGLLHIAGDSVFTGYWNRDDPDLFIERDGLRYYNTGDVVRSTPVEGYVYVGRRDRMVKRRGYRIELGEIERGLYQCEKVREAAVIAVPDAQSGVRIIACISPAPNTSPTIVELKSFCGRALPSYMNPDLFLVVDALPQTSTGKTDYQGIHKLAASPRT